MSKPTDTGPREPAPKPPAGFRKAIPLSVKLEVALAALGLTIKDVDFDHDPALHLRVWDEAAQDTSPAANDPAHIYIKIKADHRVKTSGSPTRAHNRGADVTEIARTDRLSEAQRAFRSAVLAKGEAPRPPSKWGTRKRPWRSQRLTK